MVQSIEAGDSQRPKQPKARKSHKKPSKPKDPKAAQRRTAFEASTGPTTLATHSMKFCGVGCLRCLSVVQVNPSHVSFVTAITVDHRTHWHLGGWKEPLGSAWHTLLASNSDLSRPSGSPLKRPLVGCVLRRPGGSFILGMVYHGLPQISGVY